MKRDPLFAALGRIARVAAETADLRDILACVVNEAKAALPSGTKFVTHLGTTGAFIPYSDIPGSAECLGTLTPGDLSPALRPALDGVKRVDDLRAVADASFCADRELNQRGVGSLMTVPLKHGQQAFGFLSADSHRAGAFSQEHAAILLSIADILAMALEHERLWKLDVVRRKRLQAVDALFPVIASALNVGEIFERVSRILDQILPHDHLLLLSTSLDGTLYLLDAYSGDSIERMPPSAPKSTPSSLSAGEEYEIVDDPQEIRMHRAKQFPILKKLGIRSLLRVPVYLEGGPESTLNFLSKSPHRYSEEDVPVARRVADLMMLALSHRRLAEQEHRAALLEQRVDSLQQELESATGTRRTVGDSRKWKSVLAQVARVSPTETTVLLTGESGTGKEILARMIHRGSPRAKGPFKAINCAALPETLLESELFGHEKGAFTGASDVRLGCIEQAGGGTLFLDEVGEMSLSAQAKLLRVLEEREFTRVGGVRNLRADVRVVAATNKDLKAAVLQGVFRQDLYYRLCVFEIAVPSLRERAEDILPMAEVFLLEMGQTVGRPAGGLSSQVIEALKAYPWPGNVRELRNVLERATILCDGGLITLDHLPPEVRVHDPLAPSTSAGQRPTSLGLEGAERQLIIKAVGQASNNLAEAARLLGISRSTLYRKMQKYGFDRTENR